jgi:hypothetical protein
MEPNAVLTGYQGSFIVVPPCPVFSMIGPGFHGFFGDSGSSALEIGILDYDIDTFVTCRVPSFPLLD